MQGEQPPPDNDINARARAGQDRFDYALATLCFAALALSLQFSERPDSTWRPLLVTAWAAYLTSALLAGSRLMALPQFDKINAAVVHTQAIIRSQKAVLRDPGGQQALDRGLYPNPETGVPITREEVAKWVHESEANVGTGTQSMKKIARRARCCFRLCIVSLLLAFVLNGLYLSINFLADGAQGAAPSDGRSAYPALQTDRPSAGG